MIRRTHPEGVAVIRQDDHARVCGSLLRAWGSSAFPRPNAFKGLFAAAVLHDCGWDQADFSPEPTRDGLPPDVFDPPTTSTSSADAALSKLLNAWARSAQLAEVAGPWAQLLVSVHGLTLSAYAAGRANTLPLRFLFNRFQHAQIELQEHLRRRLGMSLDWPLQHGLVELTAAPQARADEREMRLLEDYQHLQALDLLSLAMCCQSPPTDRSGPVGPEGLVLRWQLLDDVERTLRVSPWPFTLERVRLRVPMRVLKPGRFDHALALSEALAEARHVALDVTLVP